MVKAAKTIKKTVEKRQSVKYNDAYEMLQSTTEHIKKEKLRVIAHIEVQWEYATNVNVMSPGRIYELSKAF